MALEWTTSPDEHAIVTKRGGAGCGGWKVKAEFALKRVPTSESGKGSETERTQQKKACFPCSGLSAVSIKTDSLSLTFLNCSCKNPLPRRTAQSEHERALAKVQDATNQMRGIKTWIQLHDSKFDAFANHSCQEETSRPTIALVCYCLPGQRWTRSRTYVRMWSLRQHEKPNS